MNKQRVLSVFQMSDSKKIRVPDNGFKTIVYYKERFWMDKGRPMTFIDTYLVSFSFIALLHCNRIVHDIR